MSQRLLIFFQHLLPHHLLSRFVGGLARSTWVPFKNAFINWFIKRYNVDMSEARFPDADNYGCFNDFFIRQLKPGARPLSPDLRHVLSPADGAINQSGRIERGRLIQAKGRDFGLVELLGGDEGRAQPFLGGCFATVYLAPRDYHRVHMPLAGRLKEMIFVPGKLYSVNQLTSESVPDLFARNERVVCLFDTEAGPMAMVLVGAMIVASVNTVWAGDVCPAGKEVCVSDYSAQPPVNIERGEEMGMFKLGSTVVVLFGPKAVTLEESLRSGSVVRVGEAIATRTLTAPEVESPQPEPPRVPGSKRTGSPVGAGASSGRSLTVGGG
jgi:phosphatidylserine decarboxylase